MPPDDLNAEPSRVDLIALVKAVAGLPGNLGVELDDEEASSFAEDCRALDALVRQDPVVFVDACRNAFAVLDVDDHEGHEGRQQRMAAECRTAGVDADLLFDMAHEYAAAGREVPAGMLRLWRYHRTTQALMSACATLCDGRRKRKLHAVAADATDRRRRHWRQVTTNARRELRAQLRGFTPQQPRRSRRAPRGRRVAAAAGPRSPPSSSDDDSEPSLVSRLLGALRRWLP